MRNTIGITLIILILGASGMADAAWPMFRGNPALTGYADVSLSDRPALLWRFPTGDSIVGSAVVSGDMVYVGSTDGKLYGLSLRTGQEKWHFDTGDTIEATPCVVDGSVYIGSANGILYAVDAASGELRWKYETEAKILGSANWIRVDGQVRILVGSYDYYLHCVDAQAGTSVWKHETDNYINGAPTIIGNTIVFGGCDALLHFVSADEGKPIATVETLAYIAGSGAGADKHVYVGNYEGQFLSVNIEDHSVQWEYLQSEEPIFSSPAISKEYVVFGSRDKRVHCIDRSTGEQHWTFRGRRAFDSSPIICQDKLVIGSDDGRLYLLRLSDGHELWSYEVGDSITSSPAISSGVLLVGCDDGVLYAFDASETMGQ